MNRLRDALVQIGVACFSVGAIATSYSKEPNVRALSPYLGLCSQPFWFYISIKNRLWGPMLISVAYTSVFIYGLTQT